MGPSHTQLTISLQKLIWCDDLQLSGTVGTINNSNSHTIIDREGRSASMGIAGQRWFNTQWPAEQAQEVCRFESSLSPSLSSHNDHQFRRSMRHNTKNDSLESHQDLDIISPPGTPYKYQRKHCSSPQYS
jgi:hypothetical protein